MTAIKCAICLSTGECEHKELIAWWLSMIKPPLPPQPKPTPEPKPTPKPPRPKPKP